MNDTLTITGGRRLSGEITVDGSKNGALPTLAACLLIAGETRLTNIPRIEDVETMLALLRGCGAYIERKGKDEIIVHASDLSNSKVPAELAAKMRASHYLLAPLAARLGHACLPLPGGCDLGSRPVEYILEALEPLGISTECKDNSLSLKCDRIRGAKIVLDALYRSPGATFAAIMGACLGDGETTIENACTEPDVVNLCEFLNLAGGKLKGAGTSTIVVHGVKRLHGVEHRVLGDRLEAGTYLLAGAATRGDVTVVGVSKADLRGFVEALEASDVELQDWEMMVRAICSQRPKAVDIASSPFPGFPTDLQPPMMAHLATAEGDSRVEENIFSGRMGHVAQLCRMGASIESTEQKAIVHGVEQLKGAQVEALNIRAGAAMVVAALGAEGKTEISGSSHVTRGYAQIKEKLTALGADVK